MQLKLEACAHLLVPVIKPLSRCLLASIKLMSSKSKCEHGHHVTSIINMAASLDASPPLRHNSRKLVGDMYAHQYAEQDALK